MSLWTKFKQFVSPASPPGTRQLLERFQQKIGYCFNDQALLSLSLTHRSATNHSENLQESNERLEFLGDAVLGMVIGEQLYRDHPKLDEGYLTKKKAKLVSETALSQVSIEIGLNRYIFLSPEEEKAGGCERPSIVSDAFESVIGALYLDGGLEVARRFILESIYSRKQSIVSDEAQHNYKGELLELIQSRGGGLPRYDIASESGPDHNKTFHIVVTVAGQKVGDGKGSSKKIAEQKAARVALEYLCDKQ